jgi:hypothetical protein
MTTQRWPGPRLKSLHALMAAANAVPEDPPKKCLATVAMTKKYRIRDLLA